MSFPSRPPIGDAPLWRPTTQSPEQGRAVGRKNGGLNNVPVPHARSSRPGSPVENLPLKRLFCYYQPDVASEFLSTPQYEIDLGCATSHQRGWRTLRGRRT